MDSVQRAILENQITIMNVLQIVADKYSADLLRKELNERVMFTKGVIRNHA